MSLDIKCFDIFNLVSVDNCWKPGFEFMKTMSQRNVLARLMGYMMRMVVQMYSMINKILRYYGFSSGAYWQMQKYNNFNACSLKHPPTTQALYMALSCTTSNSFFVDVGLISRKLYSTKKNKNSAELLIQPIVFLFKAFFQIFQI